MRAGGKGARKATKLLGPVFFAKDLFAEGLGTAAKNFANDVTWPVSELWDSNGLIRGTVGDGAAASQEAGEMMEQLGDSVGQPWTPSSL